MSSVTSASLTQAATDLSTLATALGTQATLLQDMVSTASTKLGETPDHWGGPSADAVIEGAETYLAAVDPAAGALESAQGTVSRWATSATEHAAELMRNEQWLASISYAMTYALDNTALPADLSSARGQIADAVASWTTACTGFAGELDEAITTLMAADAAYAEIVDPAAANDTIYTAAIAQLSVLSGVDTSVIDPSGLLDEAIAEQAAFLGSEDGAWMFAIIETAHQGDLDKADGNFSEDDILAACDPATVRDLLLQSGIEFDPAELDALVSQVVGTAWMMRSSEDEVWEDIDDDIEWYARGVFKFVREEVFAPVAAFAVAAGCYSAAAAGAPATGGVSLGAAGYCGGLAAATYSAANTWAHGGDGGDVLDSFTDPKAWVVGAGTGIAFQGLSNFLLRVRPLPPPPGGGAASSTLDDALVASADDAAASGLPGGLQEVSPGVYRSPAGVTYGPGSAEGHRITHLLEHARPDPSKATHTVFQTEAQTLPELSGQLTSLVDEAWAARGAPVSATSGSYERFVVDMGRVVGTNGETSVTIVARKGTSEIITAFPTS
jgi:hypothetical protein